jgi:putative ABC transport system ATP-binding protein
MLTSEAAVISMIDVSHYYGSGALRKQVLFNITCDISPGEIVIMTGPSGSGKTTILTLVGALRSVEHGSIRVIGKELRGASQDTLIRVRQRIGFIFQAHNLLDSLTASQNVEIAFGVDREPLSEARTRAAEVLEAVGLGNHLHSLPDQLSGGQRQRVAVARAVVRRPNIILADEPTASLDKHSGREVVEILRRLARGQGCAVLLVTHDNRILDIADRVMRLEDGRMEAFGSVTSPYAGHLLTVLSRVEEKDHLRFILDRASEGDFVEMLNSIGGEVEQLLNILDLGSRQSARILLGNLLDNILAKIAALIGADAAGLFSTNGEQLRAAADSSAWAGPALMNRTVETGRIVNVSGPDLGSGVQSVLCVPIRDRLEDIRGVVQLVNKKGGLRFSDADERAFRDFAIPLGVIVEGWQRLTKDHEE